jgi:hypothetical protein
MSEDYRDRNDYHSASNLPLSYFGNHLLRVGGHADGSQYRE